MSQFKPGQEHPLSKLSSHQVREIRFLLSNGDPTTAIASRYGVSSATVSGIASGRKWSHIAGFSDPGPLQPLNMEQWKPVIIDGEPTTYEVRDSGQVRRRLGYTVRPINHNTSGRYPRVNISASGRVYTRRVHVLVARAYLGPPPAGTEVNHKDLDKSNPTLSNLEYITRLGNIEHSARLQGPQPGARGALNLNMKSGSTVEESDKQKTLCPKA